MNVFALDIGTRKVAGIIGEIKNGKMSIIDAVVKEHEKRAMLDGQIHSIDDVSKIINQIKSELEKNNNIKLEKVTTALAGRSLHTEMVEVELPKKGEITKDDIQKLEIASVKKAHEYIKERNKKDYYCVGFSVVHFMMDSEIIKSPVQQIVQEKIGIKTIVTFLPNVVFESLISVLRNCNLSLENLTLEPIAAMNVTIPEDMRLLNLALVDVGAGTSDIAIVEGGKIAAYGMIPKAGDEITEEVCNEFLVDFHTGEKIKRGSKKELTFMAQDIFNNPVSIEFEKFVEAIAAKTGEVARDVADEILLLNGGQPKAVVMVGGGSGLELLKEKVAEYLGLPKNRVGSREPKNIMDVENLPEELNGTEGVTPLGILDTALYKKGLGFVEVTINGEKEFIINMSQKITLMDALISHGYEMKSLYGRPGNALSFTVNGELKILRGTQGTHSKYYVNNEEKAFDDEVVKDDVIFISEAKNGDSAVAIISDVIAVADFLTVEVNGKTEKIEPVIYMNGKEISAEEPVFDRCNIKIEKKEQLGEVLSSLGYGLQSSGERDILVTVSGNPVSLKQRNYQLKVNGVETNADYIVKNMDKIEYLEKPAYYRIKDIVKTATKKKIKVIINKKEYELESEIYEVSMNGRRVSDEEFIINGAEIEIKSSEEQLMLSTIFRTFDMETQRVKGKMIDLRINGEKAGYTTAIKAGDEIEIRYV